MAQVSVDLWFLIFFFHETCSTCGVTPAYPQSLLITPKCLKRHNMTRIHKPPPNEVLTRLKSFLPKLANANEALSRKMENLSPDDFDIENVQEDTEVIEMNIALFPAANGEEEEEEEDEEDEEEDEDDEDDSFTDNLSFHGLKEADETVFDKVTKTKLRSSLPCSQKCGIVEMAEYIP
uniref:NOP protein chaperone 1-like isoform X2 n=1 Tax=Myxine glutinosa TaxID=7769 RepID=UPI00358FADF2